MREGKKDTYETHTIYFCSSVVDSSLPLSSAFFGFADVFSCTAHECTEILKQKRYCRFYRHHGFTLSEPLAVRK